MKSFLKKLLAKRGYYVYREGFVPKGYRFQNDMADILKLNQFELAVDIGAFHGTMTDTFLEAFPNGKVIAVEPTTESFDILKNKFAGNSRVLLQNCGAGKEETVIKFKVFENGQLNSFKSVIANDEAEAVGVKEVPVHTLEYILQNAAPENKGIDFLKIDVEGFEMEVLGGATELLKNNQIGSIFIEAGFCKDDERHTSFYLIKDFLISKGFSFYALYDLLYHHRKPTELYFANALFLNDQYLSAKRLLK